MFFIRNHKFCLLYYLLVFLNIVKFRSIIFTKSFNYRIARKLVNRKTDQRIAFEAHMLLCQHTIKYTSK